MDLNPENNKDTFRERDKKIEELELQLKILKEKNKLLENNIDTLESIIDTALYDVEYEDCYLFLKKEFQSYIDETYGIKDDSWYKDHKDPGNYRAAKTPTRKRK